MDTSGQVSIPLFLAPTRVEYSPVRKGLGPFLRKGRVRLEICGVGEKRVEKYCRGLAPGAVRNLILIGWAGGISPEMKAGDTIVAETAIREGKRPISCRGMPVDRAITGTIMTAPKALSTMEEKRLAQATGAQAVDMEGYALAEWAAEHNIQFIHARVVLDSFFDPLPSLRSGLLQNLALSYHLFKLIRRADPILTRLARVVATQLVAEQDGMAGGGIDL
jgi:purine-nucleoside phosphorylase